MNSKTILRRTQRGLCLLAAIAFSVLQGARAADTNAPAGTNQLSEADAAWEKVLASLEPPDLPAEFRGGNPTPDQVKKYRVEQARAAGAAADAAKDFYTRYPSHAQATEARQEYERSLELAVQFGNTNKMAELDQVEQARLKDPNTSDEDRFRIRLGALMRQNLKADENDLEKQMTAFEGVARQLMKEFPKSGEPFEMLASLLDDVAPEKARALAREINESSLASQEVKEQTKVTLEKLARVGKPFPLAFTTVKSNKFDIADLKGKVVLVDFWATWCGPCVRELPNVRAAYDKLHPKGFEIVGISFDQDKAKLEAFTEKEKMTWPQYFDGKAWGNDFGKQFNIHSIPTMWLVDKKGVLRDLNGRANLESKVEKLLAE